MTKKFEQALAGEFPFIRYEFSPEEQERKGRMGEPYEALYLECGDGWYQLIRDMGAEITAAYKAAGRSAGIVVDQVKEKYGTLCFYYHPEDCQAPDSPPDSGAEIHRKVAEIVDRYEERSGHVCEICGAPDLLRDNLQWIRALCDKHYQKMNGREEGEG